MWRTLEASWEHLATRPAEARPSAGHAALVTECCAFARLIIQSGDDRALLLVNGALGATASLPAPDEPDDGEAGGCGRGRRQGGGPGGGRDDAAPPCLLTLLARLIAQRPPRVDVLRSPGPRG